jgi:hypothetical protein
VSYLKIGNTFYIRRECYVWSSIGNYFDKQTGVCVEQREQTTITDSATTQSETAVSAIVLTQTNLWGNSGSSDFPAFTVIVVIVGITALIMVVVVVLRRKKS